MNPQTHLQLERRTSSLQLSNTEICIKLITTAAAAAAAPKECRICTGTQQSSDNPFVSICNCSGTLKYIHQNCLIKWMEFKMSNDGRNNIQCEVCKVPFQIEYQKQWQCRNQQQLVELIQENCGRFLIFLISAIASLTICFFGLIVIIVRAAKNQWNSSPVEQQIILLIAVIAGMALALCFIYFLLSNFFIKTKHKITQVRRDDVLQESSD